MQVREAHLDTPGEAAYPQLVAVKAAPVSRIHRRANHFSNNAPDFAQLVDAIFLVLLQVRDVLTSRSLLLLNARCGTVDGRQRPPSLPCFPAFEKCENVSMKTAASLSFST